MKRPDVEALDELQALITDFHETQEALKDLKARINVVAAGMGEHILDPEILRQAATWAYWMMPEVKVTSLAEAVVGQADTYQLRQEIDMITAGIDCDRCSEPLVFTSRTALQQSLDKLRKNRRAWAEGYRVVCDKCRDSIYSNRLQVLEAADAVREARLNELRNMPYHVYLRSPEWQERRKHHLKSAGFRCQVCNAGNTILDVHHRTYKRRGDELYKDLIVLCRGCHGLFHREGKLAY